MLVTRIKSYRCDPARRNSFYREAFLILDSIPDKHKKTRFIHFYNPVLTTVPDRVNTY